MGYDYWVYKPTPAPGRMQINIASSPNGPGQADAIANVRELKLTGTYSYTYSTNKTYQFVTNTIGVRTAASFSVSPGVWDDFMNYNGSVPGIPGATPSSSVLSTTTQSFYNYSTPPSTISSTVRSRYRANGTFSSADSLNPGILSAEIDELDFSLLGFSYYQDGVNRFKPSTSNSLGWVYDKGQDTYFWYDYIASTPSTLAEAQSRGYFPVGGSVNSKAPDVGYRLNNALYKFIPFSNFNFSFAYQNNGGFPLRIYLSPAAPILSPAYWSDTVYNPPSGSILLATITQSMSGTYSSYDNFISTNFFGVSGNRYLMLVGGFAGVSSSTATYSSIYIKNLKVDGSYHSGNNRQYVMNNYSTYSVPYQGLTGATYSAIVGYGNTINATASLVNPGLSQIYSKIGNGKFKAGIWENGVWNSGWRVDENMYEFHNIFRYFNYNRGNRWRLQVTGPTSSVAKFNIGDNVAISNIVAIDINEDRKLLKGYYTITSKTTDSIIVEFDNNFPLRRIEKDSEHHRIYVTKNVWLSGGFLNGYFTGIWNYGLFKGYPLITEMYNSHWIDGIFDGGHFYSELYSVPKFVDTIFQSGNVGLTFSSPHGLVVGDLVTIEKDDATINPQYNGDHYVTAVVNDYLVVIDAEWGYDTTNEGGSVFLDVSKGLLQKVNFKSNNISKVTSATSMESNAVFVYNSWMDLVYDADYATNIGKPQSMLNRLSRKSYSENNLYGYITKDILDSTSTFRDSFSTTIRSYRLGTKYKVFADFIGDAGNFEEDFGGTYSDSSLVPESSFLKYGWTYSKAGAYSLTFSRVQPDGGGTGEELKIQAFRSGGILDVTPLTDVDIVNKTYEEVQKLRYTKIEYDLVTYSTNIANYDSSFGNWHYPYLYKYKGNIVIDAYYVPPIHFNNLNIIKRNTVISGLTYSINTIASYLPINQNVNPFTTKYKKKVEYFYNKRNLGMHFYGYSSYATSDKTVDYVIDNLHFYEVDMIPFFLYFTPDNINKGIAVPYQGLSPFIDYTNSAFVFVDNISIGLDSIQTQNSNVAISGVGVGISNTVASGGIYYNPNLDQQAQASAVAFDAG